MQPARLMAGPGRSAERADRSGRLASARSGDRLALRSGSCALSLGLDRQQRGWACVGRGGQSGYGGEADFDGEAALRARARGELGAVRGGDRLDDGESQSVSVVVPGTGAAQSLEGLEETLDLFGRDGRAGVRDGHEGAAVAGPGGDLDLSAGGVVADRVVDQVRDQALDQSWIARRRRCGQRRANVEVAVCELCLAREQGLGGEDREVDGARAARARPGRA